MIREEIQIAFEKLVRPTRTQLKEALSSLRLSKAQLAQYIPEPTELPYGRKVLFRTDDVEIVIINLPPQAQSLPHDHGKSFGCEYIAEGELTNVSFQLDSRDQLVVDSVQRIGEVDYCFLEQGLIHAIVNEGENRVVMVNAYSPPLCGCTLYREVSVALGRRCLAPPPSDLDSATLPYERAE